MTNLVFFRRKGAAQRWNRAKCGEKANRGPKPGEPYWVPGISEIERIFAESAKILEGFGLPCEEQEVFLAPRNLLETDIHSGRWHAPGDRDAIRLRIWQRF